LLHHTTDVDALAPAPTTFEELMECHYIVPGMLRIPQGTSPPGSSQMRRGDEKLQLKTTILSVGPGVERNSSLIPNAKPVELVSFYPCM